MNVMVCRIHMDESHVQGVIQFLHHFYSLRIHLRSIADDAGMAIKKTRKRCPRTAVFGSRHRVGSYILSARRMILHTQGKLLLCRADIDHDLCRLPLEAIQHHRKHLDRSSHRHGQHHKVSLLQTLLKAHHPIHQANLLSRSGIHRFSLNAQNLRRKSPALEINGHRTSDQTQSYNSNLHIYLRSVYFLVHQPLTHSSCNLLTAGGLSKSLLINYLPSTDKILA